MILCGLLWQGSRLTSKLGKLGFEPGDFYHDIHQKAYGAISFVASVCTGSCLGDAYRHIMKCARPKYMILGGNIESPKALALWLADVWGTEMWLTEKMDFWSGGPTLEPGMTFQTWAALAAAAKVRHLAARRAVIYSALEAVRDAMNPVDGADELFDRAREFSDDAE